jgi:hypothetical protein
MLKKILFPALLALAACGAEGDPVKPGVTVTGEAQMGVSGTL